ncbi:MAG: helix-turn-helix domain-containing protein [Bacillaceae bacterium]|nr:helix-turn-helix domain-containing protein [Bacillaceae bacterium]
MKNLNPIIDKINDLYIIKRSKYLILNSNGKYVTFEKKNENDNIKYLMDYTVQRHIEGKSTLGVFATRRASKFICFDVDVSDETKARWITYKVIHELIEIGFPSNRIYTSHSGNKGYHVELFFSEPIENYIIEQLYNIVNENVFEGIDKKWGKVELRPTATQGVKLPLGKHFGAKGKRCWFVDYENGLKPIRSNKTILDIEKIDSSVIYNILERENDSLLEEEVIEVDETEDYIEEKYNPLPAYKRNIDEKETLEEIDNLLIFGLTMTGTRNNSLFKLAKYFKWQGLDQEKVKQELLNWMEWQDKKAYTSKWEVCLKDIEHLSSYVFDNDVQFTIDKPEITVTYNEILQIIKTCKSKNEKLLAYCLLVHSKRYSNKGGVFYMSYEQMSKVSGLALRSTKNIIPQLEETGILDIVERNQKQKGTYRKKPNKYKVKIGDMNNSCDQTFTISSDDYVDTFNDCVVNLIDHRVLKELLPRRQFDSIVC